MAHKCAVGGCPNNSDIIIHYILPLDPKRRSRWIEFIERSKYGAENVSSSSRVCSDHFSREDFARLDLGLTTRYILDVDAIPTVYANNDKSKGEDETEITLDEEEICNITIGSAVSLACIKDEPSDYEVGSTLNLSEDSSSPSIRQVKQEDEWQLSKEPGSDQLDSSLSSSVNSSTGRRTLKLKSEDYKEKPFSCSHCSAKFRNKGVLMQHESGHMEGKIRAYFCAHCGKSFSHRSILKAHQKVHVDMGPKVMYSCRVCSRQFCYKGSLESHMKQHLTQVTNKTFQCPICEEIYQTKGEISQHVKTSHGKCRLVCKICNASFPKIHSFFKHKDRHVVETPFFCSSCKVYQITKRGYLCHMRIHEKKRLWINNQINADAAEKDRTDVVELNQGTDNQSDLKQNYRGSVRPESELTNKERVDNTEQLLMGVVVGREEDKNEAESLLKSELSLMQKSSTDASEDYTNVK